MSVFCVSLSLFNNRLYASKSWIDSLYVGSDQHQSSLEIWTKTCTVERLRARADSAKIERNERLCRKNVLKQHTEKNLSLWKLTAVVAFFW